MEDFRDMDFRDNNRKMEYAKSVNNVDIIKVITQTQSQTLL